MLPITYVESFLTPFFFQPFFETNSSAIFASFFFYARLPFLKGGKKIKLRGTVHETDIFAVWRTRNKSILIDETRARLLENIEGWRRKKNQRVLFLYHSVLFVRKTTDSRRFLRSLWINTERFISDPSHIFYSLRLFSTRNLVETSIFIDGKIKRQKNTEETYNTGYDIHFIYYHFFFHFYCTCYENIGGKKGVHLYDTLFNVGLFFSNEKKKCNSFRVCTRLHRRSFMAENEEKKNQPSFNFWKTFLQINVHTECPKSTVAISSKKKLALAGFRCFFLRQF